MKVNGVVTEFICDGQITDTGTLFGRVDIKAASLNTKLRKRDEDLRSPTISDVEKYPDISVVITGAEPGPGETFSELVRYGTGRYYGSGSMVAL